MNLNPEPNPCTIPECLGIIFRDLQVFLSHELAESGLNARELMYLNALIEQDNITQEQLARTFHIDKGAVARASASMEKKGLIVRRPDPDDPRKKKILLTEKGLAQKKLIADVQLKWQTVCCQGIDPHDYEIFLKVLCQIAQGIIIPERKTE